MKKASATVVYLKHKQYKRRTFGNKTSKSLNTVPTHRSNLPFLLKTVQCPLDRGIMRLTAVIPIIYIIASVTSTILGPAFIDSITKSLDNNERGITDTLFEGWMPWLAVVIKSHLWKSTLTTKYCQESWFWPINSGGDPIMPLHDLSITVLHRMSHNTYNVVWLKCYDVK